ncbi:hypothetical protein CFL01nite_19130 [Corynebacterium flavescens]|uniref:HTH cro/C1-type domain-containing protein n=2 Tax=Corynebacterium flavescens TaxID=28028 RepID=A0AB73B9P3_CORFL|nr:hypothetical protein CFL01nite_19130 [Corynebacterium flavescens]
MTEKEIIRCLKRAIIREVYRVICTKRSTPQPRDLRRDELKALRIAKQLTQVVVAEHLGCAPARISDIETGKRPLTELASAYEKFLKSAWHTIEKHGGDLPNLDLPAVLGRTVLYKCLELQISRTYSAIYLKVYSAIY